MSSTRRTSLATLVTAAAMAAGLAWVAPPALAHHDHDVPATHIPLPDGFRPEGITTGSRHTAYLGSLADGDIYRLDLRTGEGQVISEGPGTPSVGLKLAHDWLFVSGGSAGNARIVDARSGRLLAGYQLAPAGTPAFINDMVVTDQAAWFTDSLDNAVYRLALRDRHHGHHGHHGRHQSVPTQADVTKVDLTGAWVQNAGNNANGIATTPDERSLLVVNSSNGLLYRVGTDGVAAQVDLGGLVLTNGDGLLREGRTLYVVQNRLNQVAVLHLAKDGRSGRLVDTLSSPDFDVPTTIARSGGDLYLPNARFTTPPTPDTEYWVTGIDD